MYVYLYVCPTKRFQVVDRKCFHFVDHPQMQNPTPPTFLFQDVERERGLKTSKLMQSASSCFANKHHLLI